LSSICSLCGQIPFVQLNCISLRQLKRFKKLYLPMRSLDVSMVMARPGHLSLMHMPYGTLFWSSNYLISNINEESDDIFFILSLYFILVLFIIRYRQNLGFVQIIFFIYLSCNFYFYLIITDNMIFRPMQVRPMQVYPIKFA